MGVTRFHRYSAQVIRSTRWKALRQAALRRDGFACRSCSARGRLEVDHIRPVRTHPELAYDPDNLQCLCPRCHSLKTRVELGFSDISPARKAWHNLLNIKDPECSTV